MNTIELIGMLAAIFTTGCWLPQVVRILRTRDVSAISLITYSGFSIGVGLWLVYGVLIASTPIIIANTITLILTLAIVGMKLVYGRPTTSSRT